MKYITGIFPIEYRLSCYRYAWRCIPTLPFGNGLEGKIPGLGVSSKQIQLKEQMCKCELNDRTLTYKNNIYKWYMYMK